MSKPEEHVAALRQLRGELGISQKKLGALTGFHGPEISQWELGKRTIKLWQFEALLNGLGYRLTWEPVSEEQDMVKGSGSGRRGKKPHGNPPNYQFDIRSLKKDLATKRPAEPEPEHEAERSTAPDSANYTDDEALGSIFDRIKRKGK